MPDPQDPTPLQMPTDTPTPPTPTNVAPAPTNVGTPSQNTPLTDLSDHYANVNGTIYNTDTNTAYSTPQQFFQASGQNSFNGLKFNTSFDPNASLNSAQEAAQAGLAGSTSPADQMQQTAQSYFDKAQANVSTDLGTQPTTNLNQMAQDKYNSLGIDDLNQKVADAQAALEKTKTNQADDLTQVEQQYQGGGTKNFAGAQDNLNQRGLKLDEIAKSIQLQTYQSLLSSKTDAWKEFNSVASTNQQQAISEWSTKLGLDKTDLTTGVQLLNQARQEADNNETQAKNLFATFATNIPGFFQALSPADQQAVSQGKITVGMLATAGKLTQEIQVKNDVAQQRANTYTSGVFGQATGLSGQGIPNGTPTQTNIHDQQTYQIAQQRLSISASNAAQNGASAVDGETTAQDIANTVTNYDLLPPALKGFFQVKRDASGNTYLASTVTTGKNGKAIAFAQAYADYWKANSSATYQPNTQVSSQEAFNPKSVASQIEGDLSSGKGWTEIRATAQSNGVPLTVYSQAMKLVYSAQTKTGAAIDNNLSNGYIVPAKPGAF